MRNDVLKIDLHSHTTHSDGKLSVEALLMRAEQMQVDVLAITDHDCVNGIAPALDIIKKNNQKLQLISGTEISTKWHAFEIHILGLDVDHTDTKFTQRLASQLEKRQIRAEKISQKLSKLGFDNVLDDAQKLVHTGCISRAHIAQVLVDRGVCANFQQAFTHYLGKNKKAFVSADWISIEQAVTWIHEAKGKAVIAHPFHYDMTTKWLRRLAHEFKGYGGDGMEVQHPNLAKKKHDLMVDVAIDAGLSGSAGSDFHAPSKWTELGRRLHLPESILPIWRSFNTPILEKS
jgi:predicted metal-dependent phosphoesterase TrpH